MSLSTISEFGTWIVALLALILSQIPPALPRFLGQFRPASVLLSSQESFGLTHHLGRVYLALHLQIENTGLTPVSIATIDCVIRRVDQGEAKPGRAIWRLPARAYYFESGRSVLGGPPPKLFIGTLHLKAEEHWQEVLHCYAPRSEDEEEKAQQIEDRFAAYIAAELERRTVEKEEVGRLVEIPDELLAQARDFTQKNFDLTKGEYKLYIAVSDRSGKVIAATRYRFTIYESNIEALLAVLESYKYGFGVSEAAPRYVRGIINPRLTPEGSDETVRKEYAAIAGT